MTGVEASDTLPDIKNYMEICVRELTPSILKDIGCCSCSRCQYDVSAIALNSLPTKYVVTSKGQIYAKLSMLHQQFDVDIITAVTHAAKTVMDSPRH